MKKYILFILISIVAISINAQYPQVPKDLQEAADKKLDAEKKSSEEAFQRALPVIKAEALKGRPYIPWVLPKPGGPNSST